MRSATFFLTLCAIAYPALGDVQFVTPAAGGSIAAGTVTITWKDSGTAPSITDLSSFTLNLFTGSNTAPTDLGAIAPAGSVFTSGNSVSVTIAPGLGASQANAYFLGMTSVATAGGTVINYSDRFSITGMTGTFDAAVLAALATVSGTSGPDSVNAVASSAATTAAAGAGTTAAGATGAYAIPYNQQSGYVRYAPMQPLPPKKITAKGTNPLWPTSNVPTATTWLAAPSQTTTYTQPGTYSFATHTNTAAAASQPTDDMEKFLARWKD